jgi:hypothetical protein
MPRGRPKGSKNKNEVDINVSKEVEESMKEAVLKIQNKIPSNSITQSRRAESIAKYKRDQDGLLSNAEYHFNEDGSIDWRRMVKDEHLFPNKSWFEARKKEVPKTVEGLKDYQLLIKLSGIKELARLRGFEGVSYYSDKCELNHVAVCCTMTFIGNYETGGEPIVFQDMANATLENTSSFATKFLETIACNRAFVRCVRNFLNIHIVGDDEIDKSNLSSSISKGSSISLSPQGVLKSQAEQSGVGDFEKLKDLLRSWHTAGIYKINSNSNPSEWNDFKDIPAKEAREILKKLKDQK